jgi:hypothetical protein
MYYLLPTYPDLRYTKLSHCDHVLRYLPTLPRNQGHKVWRTGTFPGQRGPTHELAIQLQEKYTWATGNLVRIPFSRLCFVPMECIGVAGQ